MTVEEVIAYFERHLDLYCVQGISREAEEFALDILKKYKSTGMKTQPFPQVGKYEPEEDVESEQLGG